MNIFDVIIILLILCMGVLGFRRGVFKEFVMIAGTILVLTLSFQLKDPIANFFCIHLPFFDFQGILHGATSLSIVFYQILAFLLIAAILFAVLRIVLQVTGIFEKFLKYTIVLGIPSKVCGFFVGLLEGGIILFFVLVVLSVPLQNVDLFMASSIRTYMVSEMPLLKDSVGGMNQAMEDIYKLAKEKADDDQFNYDVMDVLLKYKIIKTDLAKELVLKKKIDRIPGIQSLIQDYEKEEKE